MCRIILIRDTGELGNRLVTYAYMLALAFEKEVRFTNLCFWRYARFLEKPSPTTTSKGRPSSSRPHISPEGPLNFFLSNLIMLTRNTRFSRNRFFFDGDWIADWESLWQRLQGVLLRVISKNKILQKLLLPGLNYHSLDPHGHEFGILIPSDLQEVLIVDADLLIRHKQAIIHRLEPAQPHLSAARNLITSSRLTFSKMVGVHIRHGDYRSYKSGKWFHDHSDYLHMMEHLESLYIDDNVGYLIASDEEIPEGVFPPDKVVRAPGNLWTDMCCLALCDLIVGAPSTYSGWASFMGSTPIYWMESSKFRPRLEDLGEVWLPRWY